MTTTDSRVTDEMVNLALCTFYYRPLGEKFDVDSREDMRAAIEAVLSAQPPSVAVSDLESLLSNSANAIDYMMDTDVIEAADLRNLIKANSHE